MDIGSGTYTPISVGPANGLQSILGLGFVNNVLYGLAPNPDSSNTDVFTINTGTGLATSDGTIDNFSVSAATAGDGTFYALDGSGDFDTIDPAALTATTVNSSTGITPDGAIAEQNGTLYAANSTFFTTGSTDQLYSIDSSNGNTNYIGDTGTAANFSLSSGVNVGGTVYAFGQQDPDNNSETDTYSIDTTSGAATLVGPYDIKTAYGGTPEYVTAAAEGPADSSPAPEPSQYGMLALMGLGLGGLLLRARR